MSMLVFAPFAWAQTPQEKCTLRAGITAAEIAQLVPGSTLGALTAGTILVPVGATGGTATSAYGLLCAFGVIKQIAELLFLLVSIMVVAIIVYAAYLFLTSGGDPTKTKDAKSWLMYAIIGMVVAVIARIIPAVAITLLGIG